MSNALADYSVVIDSCRNSGDAFDLYYCPSCGYMITGRYRPRDRITYCWGPCLEEYGEPIPLTFVRGIGRGPAVDECPF